MIVPKRKDFGFGDLVEIQYLQTAFGISRRTAADYLRSLRIEPLYMGKDIYFSLPTFNRILFILSKPGSPGFVFPGSRMKNNKRFKAGGAFLTEVTDEVLKQASDPKVMAEMAAAEGRDMSVIKKLAGNPVGRPRKEQDAESD